MKISVIVPSERYLATAGVRVRYNRIRVPLKLLGWTLDIVPIDEIPKRPLKDSDIYLFSKCQDARALVYATVARATGALVGVDLFDDYFSQVTDPRFAAQRLWLEAMASRADFFLCSTPRMLTVGDAYFAPDSGHVLSDPYEEFDAERLKLELDTKTRKAKRERRIPILWFGIGDNPNFPVGLHDLAAFGDALRPFQDNDYKASLTILTDRKCIDGRMLERLRRLPVPFVIREWSKDREEEALARHLVSFLPVNFQQFSIAKSLNRGVSALVGGSQVLTAGYPLYERLGDYVYDSAASLIDDLENSTLKLSSEKVGTFVDWIRGEADPVSETQGLVAFLEARAAESSSEHDMGGTTALLHGAKSTASINRFAQQLDWLTLATPLLPGGMKCDAHLGFFGSDPRLRLRVSKACLDHLPEELRVGALWAEDTLGAGPEWDVPLEPTPLSDELAVLSSLVGEGAYADAPANTEILQLSRDLFARLFEHHSVVESELDPVGNVLRALKRN